MIAKCQCRKCGQELEFNAEEIGGSAACPNCGNETPLFVPENGTTRRAQMGAIKINEPGKVQRLANRFAHVAAILFLFSGIAFLFTVLIAASTWNYPNDPVPALIIGGSITGTLLMAAAWLYLLAQVIYIRANTQKD